MLAGRAKCTVGLASSGVPSRGFWRIGALFSVETNRR
jgi:hypothetical protein